MPPDVRARLDPERVTAGGGDVALSGLAGAATDADADDGGLRQRHAGQTAAAAAADKPVPDASALRRERSLRAAEAALRRFGAQVGEENDEEEKED